MVARSAHFLENHDEPRIASLLSLEEHRAAALLIMGLPGMRFLHDGQLTGARRRAPIQLGRCIKEPVQPEIESFYQEILTSLPATAVGKGREVLLRPRAAWPENQTAENLIIVQWQSEEEEFDLVAVNMAPHRSQCFVQLNIEHLSEHIWSMKDLLGEEQYQRPGQELMTRGLYLDLPAHGAQLFHFEPAIVTASLPPSEASTRVVAGQV